MARANRNKPNTPPVDPTFEPATVHSFDRNEPIGFDGQPAVAEKDLPELERESRRSEVALQAEIDRLRAELDTTRAERDHARQITAASPAAILDPELWPHFRVSVHNGPAWVVKAPDAANAWHAFCAVTGMLSNGADNPVNVTATEEPIGRCKGEG